ncbi:MAG: energy-coupling factor transporter transmembrane protein EcfT [Treponemataceae bacterium]|nr:energy-coupling factor transporter transmembrane protein EcfT [Treponemataceae bacterium]
MKGFLDYLEGDSILHKMHPLTKIFVAALLCASAFVTSNFFYLFGIIVIDVLLGFIGEGKKGSGLFKRTLGIFRGLFKMSIFLFVLQILVIQTGNIVIPLGKSFGITDTGIRNGLLLVMRLTAATLPLSVLISVINLNDLSNTMVKELHIPYKYAFTFTSAIRFIPVFSSEMSGIIESQKARGVDFEIKNPFKKLGMILPLCFPLLMSAVRKIEFTAKAAELRGFYFRTRQSCTKVYKHHLRDYVFTLIGLGILAGAIVLNVLI